MTRTPGASGSAPQYDVDNLSLAIQKLELAVIRSLVSCIIFTKYFQRPYFLGIDGGPHERIGVEN